jgi:general secretion pathway protein A
MYERHWQLSQAPFRPHAGTEFFCRLPSHAAALLKLRFVLEQRRACAAIVGPAGIGKSLIIRVLEAGLPESIGPTVHLNYPNLSPLELVRYLTTELATVTGSALPAEHGLDQWLMAWERQLILCAERGLTPVFVVDDAQVIEDRAIWQTWQLLLTFRERTGICFSALFAGQPELVGRLQRFPQLEERLALTCTLPQLTEAEAAEYIAHRLAVAGRSEPIFDPAAISAIWEQTGGIPRRIDRVCDFCLLVGFAEGRRSITAEDIAGVVEEIGGRRAA